MIYLFIFIIYLGFGLMRTRRKDGPGGAIAMVTHDSPKLGLLMLFICIFFWPIEKFALLILIFFLED